MVGVTYFNSPDLIICYFCILLVFATSFFNFTYKTLCLRNFGYLENFGVENFLSFTFCQIYMQR